MHSRQPVTASKGMNGDFWIADNLWGEEREERPGKNEAASWRQDDVVSKLSSGVPTRSYYCCFNDTGIKCGAQEDVCFKQLPILYPTFITKQFHVVWQTDRSKHLAQGTNLNETYLPHRYPHTTNK